MELCKYNRCLSTCARTFWVKSICALAVYNICLLASINCSLYPFADFIVCFYLIGSTIECFSIFLEIKMPIILSVTSTSCYFYLHSVFLINYNCQFIICLFHIHYHCYFRITTNRYMTTN